MSLFQFVKNELNRVNDKLDGRVRSYDDICREFVRMVKCKYSEIPWNYMHFPLNTNSHLPPDSFPHFLVSQGVYLNVANAVIEEPTTLLPFGRYPNSSDRHEKAYAAMRTEIENGRRYWLNSFQNGLCDYWPSLDNESEKDFIGFKIIEEYKRVTKEVAENATDLESKKEIYSQFWSRAKKSAIKCFRNKFNLENDADFSQCNFFARSEYPWSPYEEFLSKARQELNSLMNTVRLTDISDSYV